MQNQIVDQVIILCFIMLIGLYSRRKNFIKEETLKSLTDLLVNVTLPCLILASFNTEYSKETTEKIKAILIYSLAIHVFLAAISGVFYFKFKENTKQVLKFVTIFSNFGFMGYPIMEGMYGKIGVFYASIFGVPFNVILLTYGSLLFSKEEKDNFNLKNILLQPGILFVIIGLIVFFGKITLPYTIMGTLNYVGGMTTPLSMIIIGANFANVSIKEIVKDLRIYYVSFIKLFIVPLMVYGVLKVLKADDYLIKMCVILEAMPAAAMTTVFAEKYNNNKVFSAKCVVVTTILSIFTIPIVINALF